MSGGAIFMLIVAAMFPTLILVAVAVKLWEVRQAKRWPSAEGKVIASGVQSHKPKRGAGRHNFDDTPRTNEPRVEYEYHVDGRRYRNGRITIGEKTSGTELEAILERYPVGTAVTVYYDPANPQRAVLERDLPMGLMLAGGGCVMLFFIGVPVGIALFYFNGLAWLKAHMAHPTQAPFVAAAGVFGVLVLGFAAVFTRMILQASRWPTTPGRIVASGVEAFDMWSDAETGGRLRRHYRSAVLYTYKVNGRQFRGDRILLGVAVSATLPWLARRAAARYPVRSEVDVYYDPKSPGESVLQPYTRWHYVPWLIGAGVLALAWAIATGRMG